MDTARLPSTTTEEPRTYLVSGSLGGLLFLASGLLWDDHPFLGSLLLELGGGAFIVFLLEFLLPSALGYADRARRVALVWSDSAVEGLLLDFVDDDELDRLLESIKEGRYPARASVRHGVSATGLRAGRHRVLERTLPVGPTTMHYHLHRRRLLGRTVVITGLRRRPAST